MAGPVSLERDGALAILTLASPPLNLFDWAMLEGLRAAVTDVAADPPRGLLVRAEGRAVSGGVDVHLFDGLSVDDAAGLWRDLLDLVHTVEELPLPTVFAAHALCLTAAFELSLACDLLLAAESARFGLVETVVGLTPAMGGTQRLAERAGPARARELVMTGELYDAATLERWNVVNRVLPDEGFAEAAVAFARSLAEGPTRAHAATKAIVRAQVEGGARAADERVPELAGDLFATEDLRGAVRSFLEQGPGKATYLGR
jgi:enoyl-CoA hydratase/carnithine racemase